MSGIQGPLFQELELTLRDSSQITGSSEDLPIFYSTKAWKYRNNYSYLDAIMDGVKTYASTSIYNLQYDLGTESDHIPLEGAVLFYMDLGQDNLADVVSGDYWTYDDYRWEFGEGKLYGTNTDPSELSETARIHPASYTFICNLTKNVAGDS